MIYLIFEGLRIYSLNYLLTIITFFISLLLLGVLDNNYFTSLFILIIIFIPEFERIHRLNAGGFILLLNKLPISFSEQFNQRYVMQISGIFLVLLLLSISNLFTDLPKSFIENLNIVIANIFAFLLIGRYEKFTIKPLSQLKFMLEYSFYIFIYLSVYQLILRYVDFIDSRFHLIIYTITVLIIHYILALMKLKFQLRKGSQAN